MGLFQDLFSINKQYSDQNKDLNFNGDVSDATVNDPSLKYNRPRYIKQIKYKTISNVMFYDAEYDLNTIAQAVQLDGIINRAVNLFTEQITKNGYEISIPDDNVYKHVMNRLREIELFTNIKTSETVNTIAKQLVTYGNAYLIKTRKSGVSKFGKSFNMFNRSYRPVVGLFLVDASTMKIGLDINNKIKYYKQFVNGQEKLFAVDDVVHLYYNKIPGVLTGRSCIIPVLDDIRALRKLEEEAEILGFQYAVPLYLYKVGTDNHPAAPGEVDSVAMEINNMNTYGIMCVPHTHTVETVTNNNDPIDIIKYIEHFKKRVYTGLGVSPVAMGESDTSNRNTAEAAYLSMQSITKSYQQIIKEKLEMELLKELILDGGYNPHNFQYELNFNEIDLEATIKKETHVIQKYQANLIDRDEARIQMDMEPKLKEDLLYLNSVQIPLITAEAEAQIPIIDKQADANIKVAKAAPKPTAGTSTSKTSTTKKTTSTKAKKSTKASENKNKSNSRPTNQHGTQLSRPTFKKDNLDSDVNYVETLSKSLLARGNYKSKINRTTFYNKSMDKIKDTILTMVNNNDELDYNSILNTFSIRFKDRLNRLDTIDSDEKYNYMITSILDEIKNLNIYMELNDVEK